MGTGSNLLRTSLVATIALSLISACGPHYGAAIQEGQHAAKDFIEKGQASSISVALVDTNQVIWSQGFGLANREANLVPTENTMFGIGSVSKMFAAISVMKLAERGAIKLDEPIVTYLPTFEMADPDYRKITVRMLINHSAGFPGTEYRNAIIRTSAPQYLEQLLESLKTQRLKASPGFMSVYCNDCFTMVEAIVATTSGKDYANFVQEEIFTPLGMKNTRFANTAFPAGSYAKAYTTSGPKPQEIVNVLASGAISSTPNDIAKIAIMFLNRGIYAQTRILSEESIAQMAVDQTVGKFNPVHSNTWAYGLGWDSVSQPGLLAIAYDGWAKGGDTNDYGAFLLVSPKAGLAVIVLGVSGFGSERAKVIAERVLLRALAENGEIPSFPTPLPPVLLPVASPVEGFLASIDGEYAMSNAILKLEAQADASGTLSLRSEEAWNLSGTLKLRSDGGYSSDANPLISLRVVNAVLRGEQAQYLVKHAPAGHGHYLDSEVYAQKVQPKSQGLSATWTSRLSETWLVVNESPDDLAWEGMEPRLRFATVPELKGLIAVRTPREPSSYHVVDPSVSDNFALSWLVIPQLNGRDVSDVKIVEQNGEEWVQFDSFIHRPLASVLALQKNTSNIVTIDAEGYSEWRLVESGPSGTQLTIATTGEWRLYDSTFKSIANGKGNGFASLPAGSGLGYLVLFGEPGQTINVGIN